MKHVMLITGASSGVGRSLTHLFAGKYHVIAVARRVERLRNEFSGKKDVEYHKLDLQEPEEVDRFLGALSKKHEYIPYLINNAGVNVKSPIEELGDDAIDRSFQVNAFSPMRILKSFLPKMKENNFGRVIHLTSGAPLNCFPAYSAYSASKGTQRIHGHRSQRMRRLQHQDQPDEPGACADRDGARCTDGCVRMPSHRGVSLEPR